MATLRDEVGSGLCQVAVEVRGVSCCFVRVPARSGLRTAGHFPKYLQIPGKSRGAALRLDSSLGSPARGHRPHARCSRDFRGSSGNPGAMAPKRKQQPSQAMTSGGAAKATVNSQNNYVRIANLFLAYIKEVSPDLSRLGQEWKTDGLGGCRRKVRGGQRDLRAPGDVRVLRVHHQGR